MVDNVSEILTKEEEKYLAALYRASELGNSRVSTTELSHRLRLHPSTVSNKLKTLKDLRIDDYKIIDYEKSYGVKLTYHGNVIGGKIIRQIRIKELFLKNLGFDLVDIETEIDEIHCSERVASRIMSEFIEPTMNKNNTTWDSIRCPHGALIPDENGRVRNEVYFPLNHFPSDAEVTVHRILFTPELSNPRSYFRELQRHSLFPGTRIVSGQKINGNVTLIQEETRKEISISRELADQIYCTDQNYVYVIP